MKPLLIALLMNTMSNTANMLDELRILLYASYHDEKAAQRLNRATEHFGTDAPPVLLGYKGMAEMMKCRYTIYPLEKWLSFNRGKKFIELAIKKEPYNIELRYLRFTVQTNAPALLCYQYDIDNDKRILLAYLERGRRNDADTMMYNNIKQYMLSADCCTRQEKQIIHTLQ